MFSRKSTPTDRLLELLEIQLIRSIKIMSTASDALTAAVTASTT